MAERLDADAERADRAHDARLAAGRGPRQLGRRAVDLFRLVRQPVAVELERVGPEGVRLEDLRAGAHVLRVHFLYEPWLLAVQLVVADVQEEAIGDRKSTRLNSSHVRISYAVFCLKKK